MSSPVSQLKFSSPNLNFSERISPSICFYSLEKDIVTSAVGLFLAIINMPSPLGCSCSYTRIRYMIKWMQLNILCFKVTVTLRLISLPLPPTQQTLSKQYILNIINQSINQLIKQSFIQLFKQTLITQHLIYCIILAIADAVCLSHIPPNWHRRKSTTNTEIFNACG